MKFFIIALFFTCMVFDISLGQKSDHHIRKKRLIDITWNGNRSVSIKEVPYIVNILKNGSSYCGGSILSPHVIISAAHCFIEKGIYSILSGSTYRVRRSSHIHHQITKILKYPDFNPSNPFKDDLALLTIRPPIDIFNSPNRDIKLHDGIIPPNSVGTLSGWGSTNESGRDTKYPKKLRSIKMRISKKCKGFNRLTDTLICTYDQLGQKGSGSNDSGGPLVVNGQLVGILSYRLKFESSVLFMNVTSAAYKKWIISNIPRSEYPIGPSAAHLCEILLRQAKPNIFHQGWASSRQYLMKKFRGKDRPCSGQQNSLPMLHQ